MKDSDTQLQEQLSAFADGEIGDSEARFLIKRLCHDGKLRARWERYHVVHATLHGGFSACAGDSLCQRISDAIENEPSPMRAKSSLMLRLIKPAAGLAVAATVATVAILSIQQVNPPGDVGVAHRPSAATTVTGGLPTQLQPVAARERIDARGVAHPISTQGRVTPQLRTYLLRHNQVAARSNSASFVPYVYVVSNAKVLADAPSEEQSEQKVEQK